MKTSYYALALVLALPATAALAGPGDRFGGGEGGGSEMMRQKMHERMKEADTNNDGVISKAEFLAKAEERFNKLDKDGDGNITEAERDAMRQKMQSLKEKRGGGEGFP